MENSSVEIGSIQKKDDSTIKASITKYRKEFYVDIREYIEREDYSGPTKKGIRFHTENWDEFYALIKKINQEIKKRV